MSSQGSCTARKNSWDVFPGGTCRKESIRGIIKREAVDEITQPAFYTGCPKAWAAF